MLPALAGLACALQLGTSLARPTAQSMQWCNDFYQYTNIGGGEIVDGTPFNGGLLCAGNGKCTMSLTESYTVSTSITVGTSFTLNIEEIFSVGVDFSVTQTTGTAIGEGGSDVCPEGAWQCALKVIPYMVKITGDALNQNPCGEYGPEHYEIQSPHIDPSNNAIVSVKACACPDFPGWADPGAPETCPSTCK